MGFRNEMDLSFRILSVMKNAINLGVPERQTMCVTPEELQTAYDKAPLALAVI
jgi:hypothetical protein